MEPMIVNTLNSIKINFPESILALTQEDNSNRNKTQIKNKHDIPWEFLTTIWPSHGLELEFILS